jgi:PAS domain S-box-containing protein
LESNAVPITDAKGELIGFQGTDYDITPLIQAEKEVRKQKEFLHQVIDTSPNLIFVKDINGKFTLANKAAAEVHGTTAENLIGKTDADFGLNAEDVERFRQSDHEVITTKQPKFIAEEKVTTKTGEERWYQTTKAPLILSEDSTPLVLGVAVDITERRKLEQQLLQSQKMDAIGRLAGGVAHDFNNLLTVIIGYSELLLYQLQPNDPIRSSIQDIHKAAERAASLTSQLLAFGRKQIFQTKIIDLNSLIVNLEKMLGRLLGEDVEIKVSQSLDLKKIVADPSKIEQVIINLALNAREAMPEGGKLIITMANVELDEQYTREHIDVKPGQYVILAISDTGYGMDEKTLEHIFEPFFTTKETGKGTGLGLATVYGIVKQSGGHIWVYSEPNHGTMFKIYFPQAVEANGVQVKTDELDQSPRGTETVLLAEDEDLVMNLATRVLREKGYSVIKASNGEEALQIAHTYKGKIDLLLTDVVMPRISGRALANKIGLVRPDIKILFISGYTGDAIAHRGILEPGTAFLEKPFTPASLALKVREVLDSSTNQNEESV